MGRCDTANHCVSSSITVAALATQGRASEWMYTGAGIKGPPLNPRGQSAFNLASKAVGRQAQSGDASLRSESTHIRYLDTNVTALAGDGQLCPRTLVMCQRDI